MPGVTLKMHISRIMGLYNSWAGKYPPGLEIRPQIEALFPRGGSPIVSGGNDWRFFSRCALASPAMLGSDLHPAVLIGRFLGSSFPPTVLLPRRFLPVSPGLRILRVLFPWGSRVFLISSARSSMFGAELPHAYDMTGRWCNLPFLSFRFYRF